MFLYSDPVLHDTYYSQLKALWQVQTLSAFSSPEANVCEPKAQIIM